MDYKNEVIDSNGYTHSIDKVYLNYKINGIGNKGIDKVINEIRRLQEKYDINDYYEKLNCTPCSKFNWYANRINLGKGIVIFLGHYTVFNEGSKELYLFPQMQIITNPNKYLDMPYLQDFKDLLIKHCVDGELVKYDYAIDIKSIADDISIYGTRKEKGLYKGTRYFGQRHQHGYLKIYDKSKESNLDYNCTRVEYTFKVGQAVRFDNIYVKSNVLDSLVDKKINPTTQALIIACQSLKSNNISYDDVINALDKRMRKNVIDYIEGGSMKVEYDPSILKKLLDTVENNYNINVIKNFSSDDDFIVVTQEDIERNCPWEI